LEIVGDDLQARGGFYVDLAQGVVVGVAGVVEIQGVVAVDLETVLKIVEAVGEVVEYGNPVELELDFR